jgi:hypothetical protein
MQPFPSNEKLPAGNKFFFHASKKLHISIFRDPFPASTKGTIQLTDVRQQQAIATGTLTLGKQLFVDNDRINEDP